MALFQKVFGDQDVPMKTGIMQGRIAVNISQIDLCFARDQLETERRSSETHYRTERSLLAERCRSDHGWRPDVRECRHLRIGGWRQERKEQFDPTSINRIYTSTSFKQQLNDS